MKTKDECKKVEELRSRGIEELNGKIREIVPAALPGAAVGFSTPQPLDSWTAKLREQSENVYENKGQGQESREVKESGSRRDEREKARHDTKSQSQVEKRLLASQLLNFWTPGLQYRANKARMSMKTKDNDNDNMSLIRLLR
jgi:hypothetical protein